MTSELSYNGYPLSRLIADEKQGWSGYVEWEKYPLKKAIARDILKMHQFTPIPEFQFVPLPNTNPVLVGYRWKEYHEALGLKYIVDFSWETVQKEKPDLIHLLGESTDQVSGSVTAIVYPHSFHVFYGQDFPYNGETRRDQLLQGKITDNKYHLYVFFLLVQQLAMPNAILFLSSVRNHGGVPDIDEDLFKLEIGGLVNNTVSLSLRDLKDPEKFPQSEVTVTLQCSGTRRIEQIREYPGDGDELINAPWGEGAIGTAVYRGVPLKKVLKKACGGVLPECQHLEFIGADTYFKKCDVFNYAVSVPYRKVRANEEVLLAWEMNGKPLPKMHGAPLRLVIAGYIGARSCKWVYQINALAEPSLGPVQGQEYLYYTSQVHHNRSLESSQTSDAIPI
ncbi:Oxidoreductase, molybdopterin-binding domain-containing protein [Butyriboletus roseoflavus]|nr:Oxidoreductase, molybdopterin-binding domain-containing protein [Butyriboletus roseoflavus]